MFWSKKSDESDSTQELANLVNNCDMLVDLPQNGKIEAILYNSSLIRIILANLNDRMAIKINENFNLKLFEILQLHGIKDKIEDPFEFLEQRTSFYSNEIVKFFTDSIYDFDYIYYLFYENPFASTPKPSEKVSKVTIFEIHVNFMIEKIRQQVLLISNKN